LLRIFGVYAIVEERTCNVYVLFGKVVAVLDEPGLHILLFKLGLKAPIVRWLGRLYVLDMRIDQQYLRSQPVNSEEGAPMGIGIWYEMFISDPVAFLFKNADPRGSLATNVSNSTVRCLSNLKLADLLQNRHSMSLTVRTEVSPQSHEWGYKLGSVYIRKVHFRDAQMIQQIEEKVVNRLRQVTSSIKQDGADPEVEAAMFEILEIQKIVDSKARITLIPEKSGILSELMVSTSRSPETPPTVPPTPSPRPKAPPTAQT
jgi:regulator of protease activity HflC (stomatin/prohibitin superfamily)